MQAGQIWIASAMLSLFLNQTSAPAPDKPQFCGLYCVEFGEFCQYFSHLFTRIAWFHVLFLTFIHDGKHASFALELLYFDPILFPFDAMTCLLSDFRIYRARMA